MKRIGWILFLLGHALNMFSQVSIEKLSGSYYEITLNGQKMLIDAGCGGRIVSLKSNRHELGVASTCYFGSWQIFGTN